LGFGRRGSGNSNEHAERYGDSRHGDDNRRTCVDYSASWGRFPLTPTESAPVSPI
jgi:hypothetical protein